MAKGESRDVHSLTYAYYEVVAPPNALSPSIHFNLHSTLYRVSYVCRVYCIRGVLLWHIRLTFALLIWRFMLPMFVFALLIFKILGSEGPVSINLTCTLYSTGCRMLHCAYEESIEYLQIDVYYDTNVWYLKFRDQTRTVLLYVTKLGGLKRQIKDLM